MTKKSPRFYYKGNQLKQLRAFCAVAKSGKMTDAAEELFLSQPAISLQIRALERELSLGLLSDPARLGPYIPTEKVLMVGGTLDSVVPPRNQDWLWESLGRPERRSLPLGHYTSALAFSSIMGSVDAFLQRRFADAADAPLLADDG